MARIEQITVALAGETVAELTALVEAGHYPTIGEVVREAVMLWQDRRIEQERKLALLRAELAKGEAGPFYDAEEVFAEVLAQIAAEHPSTAASPTEESSRAARG